MVAWTASTPAGVWDVSKLPVTFSLAVPRSHVLLDTAHDELDVAARTWGRVPCTAFRARAGDDASVVPGDDGVNAVFFHEDAWPAELTPGAVAETVVVLDDAGKIHDADIHLNAAEYRFSLDGAPGTQDLRSVLVHEIGHALGLGHASDPRATMSPSGSGQRWRSLEADDIDGVCTLYPGAGSAGCDEDPCPTGFVCVAGACQRPAARADVCAPCSPSVVDACEAAGDGARCLEIADAGSVCGRPCARDGDCGSGFACRETTEAGDLQCVSIDGCRNGASPCVADGDCTAPAIRCVDGACVGPLATRAGDAGSTDAGTHTDGSPEAGGGGCGCGAGATAPAGATWLALVVVLLVFRRRLA